MQILTILRPQSSTNLVVQSFPYICFRLWCETGMLKMSLQSTAATLLWCSGISYACLLSGLISTLLFFPLSVQGREIPASVKQYPSQAHMALPGPSTPHQPLVGMETFCDVNRMLRHALIWKRIHACRDALFNAWGKIPLMDLSIVFWVKRYCLSSLLNQAPILHLLSHSG